jgi:transposase InsO family protein
MRSKTDKGPSRKKSKRANRYESSYRIHLVKLHEEDGHSLETICREGGVCRSSMTRWLRLYRKGGSAALEFRHTSHAPRRTLHGAVTEKIVSVKKAHPDFGVRKISHILSRLFFLPGSAESVRRTLIGNDLNTPAKKRPSRNVTRPRFFERSTPNQMWQTDIFTFRLGGRYAYLIGFIDDYSRYMVGLGLYMSQTAENLIELYRKATTEYGVPKEMLTDNGRQYTNWRGTSRFEAELQKDKIHHIKSAPHHPMTLGKIERFWKTIYGEFLVRAQVESFENAQERVRLWIKYYNHRRPHQGIKGLCPADRYFEVHHDLRKTIETGIAENVLEMALRGKPKEPFYMVGRFEGRSVVLHGQKGKLKVTVDKGVDELSSELEYDLNGEERHEHSGETIGGSPETATTEETATVPSGFLHGASEMPGDIVGMDGKTESVGNLPGAVDNMDYFKPVAGAGDGRDASGAGAQSRLGQGSFSESSSAGAFREETSSNLSIEKVDGQTQGHPAAKRTGDAANHGNQGMTNECTSGRAFTPSGGSDHESMQRRDQCDGGGQAASRLPQDLLRMGETGACRAAGIAPGWIGGQTGKGSTGSGESGHGTEAQSDGAGACRSQADDRGETDAGCLPTAAQIAASRFR